MTARTILTLLVFAPACAFGPDQAHGDLEEGTSGFADDESSSDDSIPLPTTTTRGMLDLESSSGGDESESDGYVDASSGSTDADSDSGSSGSESTGGDTDPYGDCFDGPIATENQICDQSCVVSDRGDFSACAPDCGFDYETEEWICPDGGTCINDLFPSHKVQSLTPVCMIPCDNGCPGEMLCKPFTYGGYTFDICMWE